MNKNKHIVEIFDYSADGAGVARLADGCVVFVDGAVRGEICEIVITKVL
jgi:predicted RNA-binding protein with TRAM domain